MKSNNLSNKPPQPSLGPSTQPEIQHDTANNIDNRTPKTFTKENIRGDGNCLFRAVSLFLHNTQDNYPLLREETVKYIRRNWETVKNHIVVNVDPDLVSQRAYCYNMRKDGTYGSSVEMLAMSEIYKIKFDIYTQVTNKTNGNVSTLETPTVVSLENRNHKKNINLLLSGNIEKGHFELLVPVKDAIQKIIIKNNGNQSNKTHTSNALTEPNKPTETNNHQIQVKVKWSRPDYKEVIWCHFYTVEKLGKGIPKEEFKIWQQRNPNSEHKLSANTLATERRFILNSNKLTTTELDEIMLEVKNYLRRSAKVVDTEKSFTTNSVENLRLTDHEIRSPINQKIKNTKPRTPAKKPIQTTPKKEKPERI